MKIWFRMVKDARILQSETILDESKESRTHKIFGAIDQICYQWDLGKPIWLEANIKEFQRRARTRFSKDHFVEEIELDYLEMEVLEEDNL